jgi:RNA polymerase sigma-70 factor (ECF subfamily)
MQRLLVNASYAEARRSRAWNANVRLLPVDGPAGPDETLALDERDRLERGFRRLPPDQRAILVFTYYLGLAPTEIAERLAIPVGTANSRLHYAQRAMRAAIEADERGIAVGGGRLR